MSRTITIEIYTNNLTEADLGTLVDDLDAAVVQVTNHQEYEGDGGVAYHNYTYTGHTRPLDVALIRDLDSWRTYAVLGTGLTVTEYKDASLEFLTGLATGFQAAGLNLVSPTEGERA